MSARRLGRVIVVRYADSTTRLPVERFAREVGMAVAEVEGHVAELVRLGFLSPRPDGTYDATMPAAISAALQAEDGR